MSLVTTADLCLYLQRDIDEPLALMLVEAAEAAVLEEIGYPIEAVTDEQITLPGTNRRIIQLPARPVTALTAASIFDITGDEDILDVTDDLTWHASGEVLRPHGYGWGGPESKVVITYSHGLTEIPKWLQLIVLGAAGRGYVNPDGSVRQEAIGPYSVTYAGDSFGVGLTATDRHQIGKRFRRRSGTAHVTGL